MKRPMDISTLFILLGIGLLAGALSGLVGIGGGIVMVPALVMLLGLSQHQAQGTSLATLLMASGLRLMAWACSAKARWIDCRIHHEA